MGGAPEAPKAPKFYPIDIADTLQKAIQFDLEGYSKSDQFFAEKFPGLVAARKYSIEDAFRQLTEPLDPTVQASFAQKAIQDALKAAGGGNSALGVEEGSTVENATGVSIANQTLEKEDADRAYFQSLIDANPQRAFGLSGPDALALLAYNQKGGNISAQQQYANTLANINAQGAYGVQTGNAIAALGQGIGSLSSLFNTSSNGSSLFGWGSNIAQGVSDARLKENIIQVGVSPMGIPIVEFEYVTGIGLPEGRWRGALAQDVLQIKPEAVEYHENGYMTLDYTQLDISHERLD